ncbi:DUF2510 domain-containing protein, partial [Streptomyces sp. HC44]
MSAPTPAPGDDRPREGYYPDPSIPGYVRYWNGASWVPGTSRPAPSGGEPLPAPESGRPASAATEETGPHFFDEDPPAAGPSRAEAQHGSRPEPATAWGADRSRQTGFGGEQDRRVRWGAPADPRVPSEPSQPEGRSEHTEGTVRFRAPRSEDRVDDTTDRAGTADRTDATGDAQPPASGGTVVFRRPTGRVRPTAGPGEESSGSPRTGAAGASGVPSARNPFASEGTMAFRAATPRQRQLRDPHAAGPTAGGLLSQGAGAAAAGAQTPAVPEQSTNSPAPQSAAAPSTPTVSSTPSAPSTP